MSRLLSTGDFVSIGIGEQSQLYQILNIIPEGLYISPPDKPAEQSLLINDLGKWKVYGSDKDYQINFISKELVPILALPPDIIRQIGLQIDLPNLISLCQTSPQLNDLLCKNKDFWRLRYIQDFGLPEEIITDWREAYLLKAVNDVWSFGDNEHGQLGLGDNEDRNVPNKIVGLRAKKVACGGDHAVVIDLDDNLRSFGENEAGQLGLGNRDEKNLPTLINGLKAKEVTCGGDFTMVIDLENNVWGFGNNNHGQFGIPIYDLSARFPHDSPVKVPNFRAKMIACGTNYTMLIDMDNNLWGFGDNGQGQLGIGPSMPIRLTPTQVPGIQAKFVACGKDHTIIIDMQDVAWATGSNLFGGLGLGDNTNRNTFSRISTQKVKFAACGEEYTALIDEENNLWMFGYNAYGQLGLGITDDFINTPQQIPGLKAKDVSCGTGHTVVVGLDGSIRSFGYNFYGQLGNGESGINRNVPVLIPRLRAKSVACGGSFTLIIGS